MPYTPISTPVYLRALIGFMAGISAADVTDTQQSQVGSYAAMADAYAQEVDQTWNSATVTATELGVIEDASGAVWKTRSVLPADQATRPGAYLQIAQSVVAKALQANAQVVAEGVDPNNTGGSSGGSSGTPLTHGLWIDGSTTTPAATQNGFIGTPFSTIQKWLDNLPASASATDSFAFQIGWLTPNAPGAYVEDLVIPAYRSIELHGVTGLTEVIANLTCVNTAAAAGATPAPSDLFQVYKNLLISGTYTFTDDGTVPAILVFESDASIESELAGGVVATGATVCEDILIGNEVVGSVTSTANATGAIVAVLPSGSVGDCICQAMQVDFASLTGSNYTVNASSNCSVFYSIFTGGAPVLTGGTWSMDQTSYNSFISAGGTLAGGATIVVTPYTNFLRAPIPMAAGANIVGAAGADNNFIVDLTGTQPQYTSNPSPVYGELARFKSNGTGGTPLKLIASAGQQYEIPGTPGTFTAVAGDTSFAAGNGGAITYQYDGIAKWHIVATA